MKDNHEWGLYGDYDFDKKGRASLVSGTARYKCKLCGKDFFEYEKKSFMSCTELGGLAHWMPFADPQDSRDRSYHISAMMSPMTTWENIMSDFVKAEFGKNILEYKNFTITNEGLPFFRNASIKPWTELKARAEDFEIGKLPNGAFIITGGADVHKGRIELQLVGWGYGIEAWSFDYQIFYGDTADINSRVWKELYAYCDRKFKIFKTETEIHVTKVAVDISYNPNKDSNNESLRTEKNAALVFCDKASDRFIAIKGTDEKYNNMIASQSRHRSYGISFYLVDVSSIKDEIFYNIDKTEGAKSIHFPFYDDEYFKQFLSEVYKEDKDKKMRYVKINPRNESLDTFVYARAVISIYGADRWSEEQWDELYSELTES
jgi:phage terminase large subunit GpA-like protein